MAAQSDPGLPGPMDGAAKRPPHKQAHSQKPKHSASATGPSDPRIEAPKRRTGPRITTRGSNKGAR